MGTHSLMPSSSFSMSALPILSVSSEAKSSSHSRNVRTALIFQNFPSRPVFRASMMQPPVLPQR